VAGWWAWAHAAHVRQVLMLRIRAVGRGHVSPAGLCRPLVRCGGGRSGMVATPPGVYNSIILAVAADFGSKWSSFGYKEVHGAHLSPLGLFPRTSTPRL
jgi:hypothetical protein